MRLSLRTLVFVPAAMAVVALASQSAHAADTAVVKVPFSFIASGKKCPAGVYTVSTDSTFHMIVLRSKDTGESLSWLSAPGDKAANDKTVSLKFDTVNEQKVLHSVRVEDVTTQELDKNADRERVAAPHSSGR